MSEQEFCTCPTEHTRIYMESKPLAKKNPYCYECWKPIARNKLTEQELKMAIAVLEEAI